MSNISGDGGSFSSDNTGGEEVQQKQQLLNHFHGSNGSTSQQQQAAPAKKKRNLPGTPDPTAEVIALSPTTLMARNRFVCEICNKGFQRDQNLQLHRRGHNLPWKLKQRTSTDIRKRVYVCPEPSCVHHNPARALGDLTGIKKHYSRKHGEKKWKCDKCSKKYAVQSDWKAHSKTCGTREYKCDCGTIFSRRDSFITHRAFCDALAEENNKVNQVLMPNMVIGNLQGHVSDLLSSIPINNNNPNTSIEVSGFNHPSADAKNHLKSHPHELMPMPPRPLNMAGPMFSSSSAGSLFGSPRSISSSSSSLQLSKNGHQLMASSSAHMSATALLQKAAQMGATVSSGMNSPMMQKGFVTSMAPSSFGGMQQQQQHNIDYIQHNTDQSQLMGVDGGGFENHFMQKGPQGISQQFFNGNGGDESTDMGMFSQLFDQNHGLLKNMENDNSNSSNVLHGRNSNQEAKNPPGVSRFGGNGSKDVTTVDFLGIGGAQPPHNFHVHEQQHQHQQEKEMEFGGMGQGRIQGLSPFQQQVSHVQTAMDKPMWEV